jgi:hypothetical protein
VLNGKNMKFRKSLKLRVGLIPFDLISVDVRIQFIGDNAIVGILIECGIRLLLGKADLFIVGTRLKLIPNDNQLVQIIFEAIVMLFIDKDIHVG